MILYKSCKLYVENESSFVVVKAVTRSAGRDPSHLVAAVGSFAGDTSGDPQEIETRRPVHDNEIRTTLQGLPDIDDASERRRGA